MHEKPHEHMYRQFDLLAEVFRTADAGPFHILSSGSNMLPAAPVWKRLTAAELDEDFTLPWYSDPRGVPALRRAVSIWQNYAASGGRFPGEVPLKQDICMTLGASQGASGVYDYVARTRRRSGRVLHVGLTFALFARLAEHHGLEVRELLAEDVGHAPERMTLPGVPAVTDALLAWHPTLLVLAQPNNPSGESYTDEETMAILRCAAEQGTFVLLDEVGLLPVTQASRTTACELVQRAGADDEVAIINSFSKSESVAGLRLGWVTAPDEVCQHIAALQYVTTLNPPTVPVGPAVLALLFRCLHLGLARGWLDGGDLAAAPVARFTRRMFRRATALPGSNVVALVDRLAGEDLPAAYREHVGHLTNNGRTIAANLDYVASELGHRTRRATAPSDGLNLLVEFDATEGADEHAFARRLVERRRVSVLTECCFRVAPARGDNFWTRISVAAPEDAFRWGIEQVRAELG